MRPDRSRPDQWRAIGFGTAIHLARFCVILATLALAPLVGVSGWYLGLTANVACVVFAVVLVSVRGLWRTSGLGVAWRGRRALLLLLPRLVEVLLWAVPAGLVPRAPGFGPWAFSLLLVGINEELTSRVVVRAPLPDPVIVVTLVVFVAVGLAALLHPERRSRSLTG
jgi:hypothetical protein